MRVFAHMSILKFREVKVKKHAYRYMQKPAELNLSKSTQVTKPRILHDTIICAFGLGISHQFTVLEFQ